MNSNTIIDRRYFGHQVVVLSQEKKLFLQILFDTDLFAYMEEIDYNWKCILLGYKNYIEPTSIIYHDGGTLGNRTYFKSFQTYIGG